MIMCAPQFCTISRHPYVSANHMVCELSKPSFTKELTKALHAICDNVSLPADLDYERLINLYVPADDRTDNQHTADSLSHTRG